AKIRHLTRPGDNHCQHHTVHALHLLAMRDRLRSSEATAARMEKGHPVRVVGKSSSTVKKVPTKCNGNLGKIGKMGKIRAASVPTYCITGRVVGVAGLACASGSSRG